MQARRFRGPTLLDAVRAARAALGPDALVVTVRRLGLRRWLRRAERPGFEVVALALPLPAATPAEHAAVMAEIQRLGARVDSLASALERGDRLADEMADLRRAVDALGERVASDSTADEPGRGRGAHVRIAGGVRSSDPTSRRVDPWTRN